MPALWYLNQMIGEFVVHVGHVVLRHVTADAIRGADGTRAAHALARWLDAGRHVAGQTPLVVRTAIRDKRAVRIVARNARQPDVSGRPASTRLQTVRLRSQGRDAL